MLAYARICGAVSMRYRSSETNYQYGKVNILLYVLAYARACGPVSMRYRSSETNYQYGKVK